MDSAEIIISGSGSELQGVGRLEDGRAVFVPGALPGERVRAEITRSRDRFAEARLISVTWPSPERVTPDCPHYGVCGGCRARHMTYECELRLKREKVLSALTRIGGLGCPLVADTLPSPLTRGYRNKAEFACDGARAGVFAEGSRSVCDTNECLLQHDRANALLRFIKPKIGRLPVKYIVTRTNSAGELMLTLSLSSAADVRALADETLRALPFVVSVYTCRLSPRPAHALDGECTLVRGKRTLIEKLCGLAFEIGPRAFFQVNTLQAERLYETALGFAELSGGARVCDIYCGAGTISLCAARAIQHATSSGAAHAVPAVTGIELVPEAIENARQNARANGLNYMTEFICGDAAEEYPRLSAQRPFDTVITDPPRAGMDRRVIEALIKTPPERVVYVSCDPATLARDVKLLCESRRFRFDRAVPVDMFPGTGHVETVCCLYHQKKDFISVPYEPKDASYLKQR